jgi:hypothetical protein
MTNLPVESMTATTMVLDERPARCSFHRSRHDRQLQVRTRTTFTRIESLRCVLAIGVAVLCKCRRGVQEELGLHSVCSLGY